MKPLFYEVGGTTSLAASTLYYWKQACGSETCTGTFTTPAASAVPVGGVYTWAVGVGRASEIAVIH